MILRQSPRTSALFRALHPEAADWGLAEQLAAAVFDAVQIGNWQRAEGKRHERPRPIPRPGVEPETTTIGTQPIPRPGVEPETTTIGTQPIPMDEMANRLGWTREEAPSE